MSWANAYWIADHHRLVFASSRSDTLLGQVKVSR